MGVVENSQRRHLFVLNERRYIPVIDILYQYSCTFPSVNLDGSQIAGVLKFGVVSSGLSFPDRTKLIYRWLIVEFSLQITFIDGR